MKILLPFILSFFLTGCSTTYLMGYHYLGLEDEQFVTGKVSKKTEKQSKPFEEKCIQVLMNADMDSFKELFTDKLLKAVPKDAYIKIKEAIQIRYKPNGQYERLPVLHMHTEHKHELDTATLFNGFDHYDYIEAEYLLYGATDAVVHLYLTEVGKNPKTPKLSGFELTDADSSKQERKFSIKYLVPETVDKAGLIGTEILKLPK
ncbi:MAG TPA: hypothetical protein VNV63_01835 [Nitrospiria bacterium]|jgi:hypothetical protein|nr:hypothetical protein [Nitrospiria bacterium]